MWCRDEPTHAVTCLGGCLGGSPTGAAEQAACRQGTGVPLTTSGISGNEAIVRHGGSCQAAAGPSCCQATVAGCGPVCPALGGAKHRSASITGSCPPQLPNWCLATRREGELIAIKATSLHTFQ